MKLCELKEIIWEITTFCGNKCSYCGSKEYRDEKVPDGLILDIAQKISEYPPLELNISGGDPLSISYKTHKKIQNLLGDKTKLKILVNPQSFLRIERSTIEAILACYELVGVSINNPQELNILKSNLAILDDVSYTIITNFNLGNVFDYDEIEGFVRANNLSWQIQYTTYIPSDINNSAIYCNSTAKKLLFTKIKESFKKRTKLILADDLTGGNCSAGQYSCGITAWGNVIPCLSMRSWMVEDDIYIAGNLLLTSLEESWVNGFAAYRCKDCKSCKDICNAPYIEPGSLINSTKFISHDNATNIQMLYGVYSPPPFQPSEVMAYAVQQYDPTFRYGVTTWDSKKGK